MLEVLYSKIMELQLLPKTEDNDYIDEESDDAEGTTPLLEEAPRKQFSLTSEKTRTKLILVTFAITYVTMGASYSVIAPFYPTEVSIWTILWQNVGTNVPQISNSCDSKAS